MNKENNGDPIFYSINKQTKEHKLYEVGDECSDWKIVEADSDGWISWEGGECPLSIHQRCDVIHKDGEVWEGTRPGSYGATSSSWKKRHCGCGIIAYRPILNDASGADAVEWDGEGLPPVGAKVEAYFMSGLEVKWRIAEVLKHGAREVAVYVPEIHALGWCNTFRPIRTPERQTVDEILTAMKSVTGGNNMERRKAEKVYTAIRDGKIPDVKLRDKDD